MPPFSRFSLTTALVALLLSTEHAKSQRFDDENVCVEQSDAYTNCLFTIGQEQCDEELCANTGYDYGIEIDSIVDVTDPEIICGVWHNRLCPSRICCPVCAVEISTYYECVRAYSGIALCALDCGDGFVPVSPVTTAPSSTDVSNTIPSAIPSMIPNNNDDVSDETTATPSSLLLNETVPPSALLSSAPNTCASIIYACALVAVTFGSWAF